MAIFYSNLYKQNPIRSTLYEAVATTAPEHAGVLYCARFRIVVPVGTVSGDIGQILDVGIQQSVLVPQDSGMFVYDFTYTTSANAGNSPTINLGWKNTQPTAYGAALTTLQSAATTTVTDATLAAALPIIQPDTLQMVFVAAVTTTTLCTVTGQILYGFQAPTI
jgi:hypothetical protein